MAMPSPVGQQLALTLPRVYPKPGEQRGRSVNYQHVIRSLASKPQAFRYSQLRDDLLPDDNYRELWALADQHLEAREACKWIVTVLRLAFEYDDEEGLGKDLLVPARVGRFASIADIQARYIRGQPITSAMANTQHSLASYDELLVSIKGEVQHEDVMSEDFL